MVHEALVWLDQLPKPAQTVFVVAFVSLCLLGSLFLALLVYSSRRKTPYYWEQQQETKYYWEEGEGKNCLECSSKMKQLRTKNASDPWFQICFICQYTREVAIGPVPRPGKETGIGKIAQQLLNDGPPTTQGGAQSQVVPE